MKGYQYLDVYLLHRQISIKSFVDYLGRIEELENWQYQLPSKLETNRIGYIPQYLSICYNRLASF